MKKNEKNNCHYRDCEAITDNLSRIKKGKALSLRGAVGDVAIPRDKALSSRGRAENSDVVISCDKESSFLSRCCASANQGISAPASCREAHTRCFLFNSKIPGIFRPTAKNRDDSLLFLASPGDLFHRHSEPQAKNPVKHTFQDWILHFASAQFRMTTGRDSLKKIATSAFRLLAMTPSTLTLAAVLTLGIIGESWAITCPSGTQGSDDSSDASKYCGVNCCWGIDSNNVLTITPALDTSNNNKPFETVTMKDFNGKTDYSSGYSSSYSSDAPWQRKGVTSVVIENGIINIGERAFIGEKITNVTGMQDVTTIGTASFWQANSLSSIDTPNVTSLGSNAFASTALSSLDLPNVTSIGYQAFQSANSLQSVYMPKVEEIGEYAFSDAVSLQSVDLSNVTSIGNFAFQNATSLESVDLSNVTSLGVSAFKGASLLTEIIIPDDVNTTSWTASAFGSLPAGANIICYGDENTCYQKLGKYFTYDNCPITPKSQCECDRDYASYGYCLNPSKIQFPTVEQCSASENYYYNTSANDGNGGCRKLPNTQETCTTAGFSWVNDKCAKTAPAANPITPAEGDSQGSGQPTAASCAEQGEVLQGNACVASCGSSFKLNDGECDRIRYTPAEAAQYLKDTDNEIIMTFKVNR